MDSIKSAPTHFASIFDYESFKTFSSYVASDPLSLSALALTDRKTYGLFQPNRLLAKFLQLVVYGKQDKAEELFTLLKSDEKIQELLCKRGKVTDYSGRIFESISAYGHAYWSGDTHMRCMLEQYMDASTKVELLKQCREIEEKGVIYTQNGVVIKGSKCFDFMPLVNAKQDYLTACNNKDWYASGKHWLQISREQLNVPAHVANEYCRTDRSFTPTPTFKEKTLPRELTITSYDQEKQTEVAWYPRHLSESAVLRYEAKRAVLEEPCGCGDECITITATHSNLIAIKHLDAVRTAERQESLEFLNSISEPGSSARRV